MIRQQAFSIDLPLLHLHNPAQNITYQLSGKSNEAQQGMGDGHSSVKYPVQP